MRNLKEAATEVICFSCLKSFDGNALNGLNPSSNVDVNQVRNWRFLNHLAHQGDAFVEVECPASLHGLQTTFVEDLVVFEAVGMDLYCALPTGCQK